MKLEMPSSKLRPGAKRKWFCCPVCKKHLCVYDDVAKSRGVYIKCKECGNEVEIKI